MDAVLTGEVEELKQTNGDQVQEDLVKERKQVNVDVVLTDVVVGAV